MTLTALFVVQAMSTASLALGAGTSGQPTALACGVLRAISGGVQAPSGAASKRGARYDALQAVAGSACAGASVETARWVATGTTITEQVALRTTCVETLPSSTRLTAP